MSSFTALARTAKTQLAESSDGNLPLLLRNQILGRFDHDLSTGPGDGKAFRFLISYRTVEKVIPIWKQRFATDEQPLRWMAVATAAIQGHLSPEQADSEWGRALSDCDDRAFADVDSQTVVCVGYAAAQLIAIGIRDELLNLTNDEECDPEEFSPALLASCAYSNGFTWTEGSSISRRREFWEWWLDLVDEVYTTASQKSV